MPKGIPKNGVNSGWFERGMTPHNKTGRYVKCKRCSKPVWEYPKQTRKYCSRSCYWKDRKGKSFVNSGCFKLGSMTGPKNPRWKGGSEKQRRHKHNPVYASWRKSVFERDNYTCKLCGLRGKLEAHHIKRWCDFPELRYEVSNGITLCIECHRKVTKRVIWIVGQSGSGKTTMAKKLKKLKHAIHLDGDDVREIWTDLGFSKEDRVENNMRVARLAKLLKKQKKDIIISTICPYRELRDEVKRITGCRFIELDGGKQPSKEYPYEL